MIRKAGNARQPKYGNKKIHTVYGTFDSKGEWQRYLFLADCEDRGKITGLRRQVRFPLEVNGAHICDYVADFVYTSGGVIVVEDFKGMITDVFRLKAKLFEACMGFPIRVVKSPTDPA